MKHTDSISMLHIIFLSMTVVGLKNHVTIIPPILGVAGRDGWISVLLTTLFMIPWIFLILYIHKQTNMEPMKDWLKQKIGKVGTTIVKCLLAICLLAQASFTTTEMLIWVKSTFLSESPMFGMLLFFTVICILLISTSLQTIVMTNVVVLVGVVSFGFFAAFTNMQVKDYALLQPFLEKGIEPVLMAMIYPASGLVELFVVIFLQHKIKDKIRFRHYLVIFFILTGLTMGPLVGAITEFGPVEASQQRFPAYEEWGLVHIGRFIEHLDFFSIYQWVTGAFIRVGILLYIIVDLFNLSGKVKKISFTIAPIYFISCLLLFSISASTFHDLKGKFMVPTIFFIYFVFSLIMLLLTFIFRKNTKKSNSQQTN